jgi:hypothetical protein
MSADRKRAEDTQLERADFCVFYNVGIDFYLKYGLITGDSATTPQARILHCGPRIYTTFFDDYPTVQHTHTLDI